MANLWLIIQREFVSNMLTSRFMIGFIVCLLSTVVAVFVQVDDYEKRLSGYNTALREAQEEAREWDLYVNIRPKAHRKPNPLGIFNVGTENDGANTVTVELSKPIFEFNFPVWEAPTQKRGSDNPFLAMFLTVDVAFIFKIVLSALAILFAYNTISGEREDGTLKLVLSNSIPRDIVVLGKYLGGMLSLFPIVLVSLIVALLIAFSSPVTAFDGNDMLHIVLIFGISLLYVSTWYLLGLLLSVWTKTAATTLILSMFIWVILTSVHSNVVTFAVEKFPLHPSKTVSRGQVLLGKYLGAFLTLMVPLVMGVLMNLLVILISGNIPFASSEWLRILGMVGLFALHISIFIFLGLFFSSRVSNAITSLVWLLLTWVCLAFVFPSLLGTFVSNLNPIPSVDEISMRTRAQLDQINDEWREGPSPKLKKAPSIERPSVTRLWATYFTAINDADTQIADAHIDQQLRQVQFARDLTQISPIATFQYAMEGLANTSIMGYMNFVKQARRYRQTFIDFIKTEDQSDPESLHIYPVKEGLSQKPVNLGGGACVQRADFVSECVISSRFVGAV